jgi:glycosyltransferase involved in cell wall biosynthesis
MKIALYNLTTTTKSGGIETFNWELAKVLAKRGHAVDIYGGKSSFVYESPPGIRVFTYPFVRRERFPNFGTRFRRFMERLSFGFFSLRDLIGGNYDYLYLIKPYDIPVAMFASARSKVQVIFGSSGTEFFPGYKQLVRKVHYFFACSEFNASQIERYCGIRPVVLPNGIDTELFRPLDPDEGLKHTLKVSERDVTIMTVGRLVGLKGIKYAIMAVGKLIKKGYALKYFVIGEGQERDNLQRLIESAQLKEHVFLLGNIPNNVLPRYYSLAKIAVFPGIAEEAFGISVAEAMACGVPSVCTAVGAIPEVAGDAGLLVTAGDDDALADALGRIISDDALRRQLGASGRKRIEENFSWNSIIETFEGHILRESM